MSSWKEQVVDWAIEKSKHGSSLWMPFALIGVSALNSLTGGMFVWCVGIVQAVLFTIVGMSNGKVGVVLAPICLTLGASVAVVTYIQLMKTSGADALLAQAGLKDSSLLQKAQEYAQHYGFGGLIFVQVNPLLPVPTAVLVVAAMAAKIDEYTTATALLTGKFLALLLNSVVVYIASQGKTIEECLRENLKGEAAAAGGAEEKKED
eukprot:TRINITY_DN50843_c0_g1_i1.p1 TRINITY_DN50843_c0_g1~~TRINITY_DN50843_c0_g1_i1.p1  ORF type:complete len:206 (+),score=45.39 TRINITY_DN50843_c0_g1_i1:43-660(+)